MYNSTIMIMTTKRRLLIISTLIITLLNFIPTLASAQSLDYPKDTIDGKVFYRYRVERGEGLYRVSVKFGVSQQDILKYNPDTKADGLKLDQILLIPTSETIQNNAKNTTDEQVADTTKKYIEHVIQPKETLFALSKKYGVPMQQLEAINPEVSRRMHTGKILLIPNTPSARAALRAENQSKEAEITTKPQEVKEPVQQVAVKKTEQKIAPKEVKQQKVASDLSIFTADSKPVAVRRDTTIVAVNADTTTKSITSLLNDSLQHKDSTILYSPISEIYPADFIALNDSTKQIPIRVAYLLPLMLDATRRDANMDRFLEFYEGSLLAINDLQKQGLKIEIFAFDIEKNDISLKVALQTPALKTIDAIIGPAYPAQVDIVSEFAQTEHIPAIIPFTSNVKSIDTCEYLLRFNLTQEQESDLLFKHFAEDANSKHFILIDLGEETKEDVLYSKIINEGRKNHLNFTTTTIDNLQSVMKSNKENVLVFKSLKFADAKPHFETIQSLLWDYNVSMVGQYNWAKYDIPTKIYYASIFDVNDDTKEDLYAEEFNFYYNYPLSNTNPRYDILGYDITLYTFRMLYENQLNNEQNKTLQEIIPTIDYRGIQSNIHFDQIQKGAGFSNRGYVITKPGSRM